MIRITSRVDLAMSVCPSVRMNAEISETVRARLLRFGVQIPALLSKFVSVECHAHSNAHKPGKFVSVECHAHSNAHKPSNCGSYSFDARIKILTDMLCVSDPIKLWLLQF